MAFMPHRNESGAMENLPDIAVFVKVVALGSFTAAADALETSQPVVSKAVSRLEKKMGVRLLNRTTRRLSLTEAGAELYRRSSEALATIENAELEIARYQTEPRGLLRVNAPTSFALMHLGPRIARFLNRNPGVTLDLTLEDRTIDLVAEGYDVAIRIGALESSGLVARKLAPCRQVICAAREYLARRGTPAKPEDLLSHDCLLYTLGRDPRAWRIADEKGRELLMPLRGRLQTNNGTTIRDAAVQGLGLAFLPTFYVAEDLRAGRLMRVLGHLKLPEQGVYVIYPERRSLPPKVRAFIDFCVQTFGQEPYWDRGLGFGRG
jgi:DNA-binding transcriptional LysR family regulator